MHSHSGHPPLTHGETPACAPRTLGHAPWGTHGTSDTPPEAFAGVPPDPRLRPPRAPAGAPAHHRMPPAGTP